MKTNYNKVANSNIAWALVNLFQRKQLPIDGEKLRQQLPALHDLTSFRQAASKLGLNVIVKRASPQQLHELSLPVVAFIRTPGEGRSPDLEAVTDIGDAMQYQFPCVVIRASKERVVYQEAGSQTPIMLSVAEFGVRFTGQVVVAARETVASPGAKISQPPSECQWLLPTLVRSNRVRRNVLFASLTVQLVALAVQLVALIAVCQLISSKVTGLPPVHL